MKTLQLIVLAFTLMTVRKGFCRDHFESASYFICNKGQIKDQCGKARTDVDYVLRSPGVNVMIGRGKLSYCFYQNTGDSVTIQRTEMILAGIQRNGAVVAEGGQGYVEHYYRNGEVFNNVPAAERICYKNIYKNIDWVLYVNNGKLEHEFVLHEGANAADITWRYKGADNVSITEDGAIVCSNSLGKLREKHPESFDELGKQLFSSYTAKDGLFAYKVAGRNKLTIDPTVEWATYVGGTGNASRVHSICTDHKGYLYACGISSDNADFASSGAFQTTLKGGSDGFISKFDTSGHHIWTTYYGGEDNDLFTDIQYNAGSVYCTGWTLSKTGISTPGTQQENWGGTGTLLKTYDGMLIKFDASGARKWGTYCGGRGADVTNNLSIDVKGNIYTVGQGSSKTNIATPGAFQDTISQATIADSTVQDGFIVKYDSTGKRIWGTYVGGFSNEYLEGVFVRGADLFVSGYTFSGTNIATPGCYQPTLGSTYDALVMRFDTAGKRIWGTYFGGNGYDFNTRLTCNSKGYVYISGITNSTSGIASPGAWQKTLGGKYDIFLAKFSPSGNREWGTYLGGTEDDYRYYGYIGGKIECDTIGDDNNVYIFGETKSPGLATSDAFQKTLSGSGKSDAFLASFNGSGSLSYFTYYGGPETEFGTSIATDAKSFYLTGSSNSTSGIATKGAYKETLKNSESGFIVKFKPGKSTGINEVASPSDVRVTLAPNPTSNVLNIKAELGNSSGEARITILNIAGKAVQMDEAKISDGHLNHTVDLFTTLSPGVYFVRLDYGTGNYKTVFTKM